MGGTWSLFVWSLKSDTRTFSPHAIRAVFCLIILITVLVAWASSSTVVVPVGLMLFKGICYTNVAVITVAGISYFVSAVTEEKDSGNLALLKMAGVTSFSIVLSKSVSRQIAALALLVVQIPFTQLAVTLGGISPQQIFAAYIALAGWLLLVSNTALLCSVVCRSTGKAAALATVLTVIFFITGACLEGLLSLRGTRWLAGSVVDFIESMKQHHQLVHILPRLQSVLSGNAQTELLSSQFWRSIVAAGTCFGLSVLLFDRFSGESQRPEHGRRPGVRRVMVNRAWSAAIAWKDFVFFGGGKATWTVKLVAYLALLFGFAMLQQLGWSQADLTLNGDNARVALITVVLFVSLELLMYSSNSLFLEMYHRTAPDLLMLPTSTRSVLWQKVLSVGMNISPGVLIAIGLALTHREQIFVRGNWLAMTTVWLLVTLFLVHLSTLLSLYLKWAALPVAVFITILLSPVFAAAAMGTFSMTGAAGTSAGFSGEALLSVAFSLGWMWLFVLLPIQLEIVASWKRLGARV